MQQEMDQESLELVNTVSQKSLEEVKRRCRSAYNPRSREPSPFYRLPESIKSYTNRPYDANIVKLGILHQEMVHLPLSQIEEKKVEAVQEIVLRLHQRHSTIDDLVEEIHELNIRELYDNEAATSWDGNVLLWRYIRNEYVLVWRLIMDGCFILEFLSLENKEMGLRCLRWDIFNDIFKLENQIPLAVLVKILEVRDGTKKSAEETLARILYRYPPFQRTPFSLKSKSKNVEREIHSANHLLKLVDKMVKNFLCQSRMNGSLPSSLPVPPPPVCFPVPLQLEFPRPRRSPARDPLKSDSACHLQSAENLQMGGIKFEASEDGEVKFQKRWFGKSILFLPKIYVDHDTEGLLRNLIAFNNDKESREEKERAVLCQFMILMNCLIQNRNDVAILRKEGILDSRIGSDKDLAAMFSNLCKGLIDSIPYYEEEVQKVEEHCNKTLIKWMNWYREYLTKPWHVISVVAAAIVIALTAIQTVKG